MAADKEKEILIIKELNDLFQKLTGNKEITLTTRSKINESIGLTSLGVVQYACMIEDYFGISIPNKILHSFRKINDIIKYINKCKQK